MQIHYATYIFPVAGPSRAEEVVEDHGMCGVRYMWHTRPTMSMARRNPVRAEGMRVWCLAKCDRGMEDGRGIEECAALGLMLVEQGDAIIHEGGLELLLFFCGKGGLELHGDLRSLMVAAADSVPLLDRRRGTGGGSSLPVMNRLNRNGYLPAVKALSHFQVK